MIVVEDNLFGFELTDFINLYKEKQEKIISLYNRGVPVQLIRGGTSDIDTECKVIGFE
ncbi:hypothetical protein [Ruoffia sp. FAM 26255]|uniref:hypothetical protein n=1 Tax=Ruoffia sp. FAM 26255 TaxID=3259519 RepID=UPI00388AA0A6